MSGLTVRETKEVKTRTNSSSSAKTTAKKAVFSTKPQGIKTGASKKIRVNTR